MRTSSRPLAAQLGAALVLVALAAGLAVAAPAGAQQEPAPVDPEPSAEVTVAVAEQIAAIDADKGDRTPAERKVDSNLLYAAAEAEDGTAVEGAPTLKSSAEVAADGTVEIDITATVDDALLGLIEDAGGEVIASVPAFDAVRAVLPVEAVAGVAADRRVRTVTPAADAQTNAGPAPGDAGATSVGVGANEADVTHGADVVRDAFGFDGTGVKACVISDGVETLADRQATGDLPAVDVLPGREGQGDEGTAMLELIHDIAPGAVLGFATALPSQAQFAQNILDLRADGCDVIVDDVTYFTEAAFQDDDVARAVTAVRADGAIYFTSAGNSGNQADGTSGTWQGDFQDAEASADPLPTGLRVHGWGVDQPSNVLTEGFLQWVTLQWADPLDASTNDYDLYVLDEDGTSVVSSSTTDQSGTQDPFEMAFASEGEQLVVARDEAAADRYLAVYTNRGTLTYGTGGASYGHNASVDAISTGATPAAAALPDLPGSPTGPFPEQHSATDTSELFTSDGPARSFYAPDGTPLTPGDLSSTGGVVRSGVDLTAADGATTTTPGFGRFFGTSAAAPNAAAIAALALSGDPTLTPAEIETAMTSTAIDIETEGVDPATGAGIVMAPATIAAVGLIDDPYVVFGDRTITEVEGDGDGAYEPGEVYDVAQTVRNGGAATASGLAAVLTSSSPDATAEEVTPPPSALAPGAEGVATARVRIASDCACGARLSLTWSVTYGGGGPGATSTGFELFVSGGLGLAEEVAYTGPPVPIPDGDPTGASVAFEVGDVGTIGDVTLTIGGSQCSKNPASTAVGLSHAYVSDLTLLITSPGGTTVTLAARRGGAGHNLCQTVFSDDGATPFDEVSGADAPFTGTFRPDEPLSAFDGEDPQGTWTMMAVDGYGEDPGTLRAVSLAVAPLTCDQFRSTDAFVDAAYRDFLGRPAEVSGLAFWGDRLLDGRETRATVARKVARSAEYAGIVTRRAYRQYLGRSGGAAEVAYWSERVRAGLSVSELPIHLLGSAELLTRSGGTSGAFVHELFDAVLHRRPTAAERADRLAALARGTSRATVARALHASVSSRRLRTATQYDLLLDRAPTTAERDQWVRRLATLDDRDLAVALAASPEYLALAQED